VLPIYGNFVGALHLPLEVDPPVTSQVQQIWGNVTVRLFPGEQESPNRVEFFKNQVEMRCPIFAMVKASGCNTGEIVWKLE